MENGNVEKVIKGVSLLLGLDWYDMVYGMVPDYMHGFNTWSDQNKSLTYVFAFKFKQTLLCSKKTLKVLTKY